MRLDKFIAANSEFSRAQVKKLLRQGEITVNGEVVGDPGLKLSETDQVCLYGEPMREQGARYFMLHKPRDYVCSTDDPDHLSVLYLLDEQERYGLHMAGRLDLDTTGLVLLTDDGQWSHRVTSPRHECHKRYRVWLADPLPAGVEQQFLDGVQLKGERQLTRPATLERINETEVLLTISEGKYHQVKRMFAAVGNKVVDLHREAVGELELDPDLAEGQYRALTAAEIALF